MLRVVRALNNNVVWACTDDAGPEVIVIGKGLGFPPLPPVLARDDPRIEKMFMFVEGGRLEQLRGILSRTEPAVLGAVEESLSLAAKMLAAELPEQIHVSIADHISFAVIRLQQGVTVPNPFLPDIQVLYGDEYRIAAAMCELMAARTGVRLPDDEQGFLALHLVAARQGHTAKRVTEHTALVSSILGKVRERYGPAAAADEFAMTRLAVHLRYALENIAAGRHTPNPLRGKLETEFPETYRFAVELAAHISARLGREAGPDETGYLAIHLLKLNNTQN